MCILAFPVPKVTSAMRINYVLSIINGVCGLILDFDPGAVP